jgi:TetR/AcrR family transcriptional repressor of nem operon
VNRQVAGGCSVEDITSLAGVPKGSFYNHFESKEDLANEMADHSPVIRERLKSIFASWTRAIASVVREGQMAGEITSPQKAQQLAGFLLSAWEGTLVRARCTKDLSPLKDFNEVVFSALLK